MGIEKEHQEKKSFLTICAHVLHVLREHMGEREQDKKDKGEQEKKGRGRKKQTEAKKKEQSKMALKRKRRKDKWERRRHCKEMTGTDRKKNHRENHFTA